MRFIIRFKAAIKDIAQIPPFQYWKNFKNGKQIKLMQKGLNHYFITEGLKKLQIGSGGNKIEGWFNTDIQLEVSGVFYMDAGIKLPIGSGTFDFVYSEHVFEHLTVEQQINYLSESYRILKPGGRIRIATPDLSRILSLWTDNNKFNQSYVLWNFNTFLTPKNSKLSAMKSKTEYVINNYMRDWGHQMVHSKNSLEELIFMLGFEQITFFEVGQSGTLDLQNLERHCEMIGVDNNIFETMILEAIKS